MIELTGNDLTLDQLMEIARHGVKVVINDTAKERVLASRKVVDDIVKDDKVIYGITTGFGKLSDEKINACDVDQLQENLLLSHACGIGDVLDKSIVRAMMALRINALIKGYSGIRLKTIEKLQAFLNKDIVPVVYAQGSLGASGDLVPLAHMALPLIGRGEVIYRNERMPTKEALLKANETPLENLKAKEGLALINGTQAMTAMLAMALDDANTLFKAANLAGALTYEALEGIIDVFTPEIHKIRNQHGQITVASIMREALKDSKNTTSQGEKRVQDAYALRCIPQVHGASLDALKHVSDILAREMNAMTDNPVITSDKRALSAGNFHGQSIALAADYLSIAVSELANISERRTERLVNPALNNGLPPFLTQQRGLHSGFMIVQYVAASIVSENKTLSHPASVDSIPSSGNQEDHVSMGTFAARKAMTITNNTRRVIAIEWLSAAQALNFRGMNKLSPTTSKLYDIIRKDVPFIEQDTIMHPYIERCEKLINKVTLKEF